MILVLILLVLKKNNGIVSERQNSQKLIKWVSSIFESTAFEIKPSSRFVDAVFSNHHHLPKQVYILRLRLQHHGIDLNILHQQNIPFIPKLSKVEC